MERGAHEGLVPSRGLGTKSVSLSAGEPYARYIGTVIACFGIFHYQITVKRFAFILGA